MVPTRATTKTYSKVIAGLLGEYYYGNCGMPQNSSGREPAFLDVSQGGDTSEPWLLRGIPTLTFPRFCPVSIIVVVDGVRRQKNLFLPIYRGDCEIFARR